MPFRRSGRPGVSPDEMDQSAAASGGWGRRRQL